MKNTFFLILMAILTLNSFCKKDNNGNEKPPQNDTTKVDTTKNLTYDQFAMGADLSYVNQIEDHGGVYKDSGQIRDPYSIFKEHGANLVRLRLWHNPTWTKTVYGTAGTQLYNDLPDVEKSMKRAKDLGMAVCLDFHYSDTWADPGKQNAPAAWVGITDTATLRDSVYQYTYNTLHYLNSKGLMPEIVQIGNEINCGLFFTNKPADFPLINVCNYSKWKELGTVINSGIKAVRDVSLGTTIKTKIALHVAEPKNLKWWFDNIKNIAKVYDYDILGFSYYPLWHTNVSFDSLPNLVKYLKARYNKKVMLLETGYPWTTGYADSYNNRFGSEAALTGFPFTKEGQNNYLKTLTQNLINAGASGIIYWEPAWITSQMKDLWGTGSSWENCTFFDFNGNTLSSIDYMRETYTFPDN